MGEPRGEGAIGAPPHFIPATRVEPGMSGGRAGPFQVLLDGRGGEGAEGGPEGEVVGGFEGGEGWERVGGLLRRFV